jgi:S-ribosylhomocysteine lyase LuxS involved in autoinducer biosynthesis
MTPPQSELSKLAQQYNSLIWQFKGNIGSVNQLECYEYLIRQLSEAHREAHKYTMKLTQEKESKQ